MLARAIDHISGKRVVAAVGEQDKAIEALKEAERILAAEEEELVELIKELEEIIAQEKELKSEVEEADQNEFRDQQSQFEARQLEVRKDLADFTGTVLPEAAELPVTPPAQFLGLLPVKVAARPWVSTIPYWRVLWPPIPARISMISCGGVPSSISARMTWRRLPLESPAD